MLPHRPPAAAAHVTAGARGRAAAPLAARMIAAMLPIARALPFYLWCTTLCRYTVSAPRTNAPGSLPSCESLRVPWVACRKAPRHTAWGTARRLSGAPRSIKRPVPSARGVQGGRTFGTRDTHKHPLGIVSAAMNT
eukprot:COSAG01_NODE_6344_length_3723_cov_68.518212_7_plen_136_part_00